MKIKSKFTRIFAACLAGALESVAVSHAATHPIASGASQEDIQRVLSAAADGDTVSFAAATYSITAPLVLKSGLTVSGPADGRAVFDATASAVPIILKLDRLDRVQLRRLEFRNLLVNVNGIVARNAGRDITVEGCWFRDARRIKGDPSVFLTATYITGLNLRDCVFLRSSAHHGNGIQLWRTHRARVEHCHFGEFGTEFPAKDAGHFKSAIAVNGWGQPEQGETVRCVDVQLRNNVLRRSPAAIAEEDHGIYALGARGLVIEDNDIAGWSIEMTGGAIKARDGEDYIVRRNRCEGSGILLYNYKNCGNDLVHALVTDNTVHVARWDEAIAPYRATGISYWRNFDEGTERSIRIENNRIENGVIVVHQPVNVADFNADGGGIRGNQADAIVAPAGVAQEKNTVRLTDWKLPPLPPRPTPPPPIALNPQTLATDEGLVDGLNAGVIRVRTKTELLHVPLKDAKVLAADGRELMGREIILYVAKRGTRLKLTMTEGKVSSLQVSP